VVGAGNPNLDDLRQFADSESGVRLLHNVADMPALMAWADLAIAAGGSTNYELAFMGLPTITVILAENQRSIAEGLADAGIVRNLGDASTVSDEELGEAIQQLAGDRRAREAMSSRGHQLVDGLGTKRVIGEMERYKSHGTESRGFQAVQGF
jgi:spore coat polysaccharide biosynthesis predicted glycosyltransferase SpsG